MRLKELRLECGTIDGSGGSNLRPLPPCREATMDWGEPSDATTGGAALIHGGSRCAVPVDQKRGANNGRLLCRPSASSVIGVGVGKRQPSWDTTRLLLRSKGQRDAVAMRPATKVGPVKCVDDVRPCRGGRTGTCADTRRAAAAHGGRGVRRSLEDRVVHQHRHDGAPRGRTSRRNRSLHRAFQQKSCRDRGGSSTECGTPADAEGRAARATCAASGRTGSGGPCSRCWNHHRTVSIPIPG
jgi:hypothetical protein